MILDDFMQDHCLIPSSFGRASVAIAF